MLEGISNQVVFLVCHLMINIMKPITEYFFKIFRKKTKIKVAFDKMPNKAKKTGAKATSNLSSNRSESTLPLRNKHPCGKFDKSFDYT